MDEFIKYTCMFLFIMSTFGIFMNIPVEEYQKSYLDELNKIKTAPQKRLDATYRYIEAIENGQEDISQGVSSEPPRKYYIDNEDEEFYKTSKPKTDKQKSVENKKYQKPLFIRDEKNPTILHPYQEK